MKKMIIRFFISSILPLILDEVIRIIRHELQDFEKKLSLKGGE